SSAGHKCLPALIDNERALRNRRAGGSAKATRWNLDELRVGYIENPGLVAHGGKVGAPGDVLGMLTFLDLESGNTHHVIVLQRQLHGLAESQMARLGGGGLRTGRRNGTQIERQTDAKHLDTRLHDFAS